MADNPDTSNTVRLNKAISDTGLCSRREADKLIEAGRVTLNGKVGVLGDRVKQGDQVAVDGKPISSKEELTYIVFNKPRGITCTTERRVKGNIIDYIKHPERIFPVGRLDKDSEGLILLTNDGNIVNKILRAGNNHEKEYVVRVNRRITNDFIKKMGDGVPVLDTITQKCYVRKDSEYTFTIILKQGLNRQIRRMCSYLGYEVAQLQRVRIMNINLKGLGKGQWRDLTKQELDTIQARVANSVKTEEASRSWDE